MRDALILTTYPLKKPYHGGQQRVIHLMEAYRKAGLHVVSISMYDPDGYSRDEVDQLDIPFPHDERYRKINGQVNNYLADYLSGEYLLSDMSAWFQLSQAIKKMDIALIHVEHPWLWKVAKRIQQESDSPIILVYGSANIESKLKRDILIETQNNRISKFEKVLSDIEQLEVMAATQADIVLTVTDKDKKWFLESCPDCRFLDIPNGTKKISFNKEEIKNFAKQIDADQWFSFVGSAHPPNFNGFRDRIGQSLACLPPTAKLVIVGAVCHFLQPYLLNDPLFFELNSSRTVFFPKAEDDLLHTILAGSKAILLPITTGGGSNLKTAEALVAGTHIIGTHQGFRGYEEFSQLSGVVIADQMDDFKKAIRDVSQRPFLKRSLADKKKTEKLFWVSRTEKLTKAVMERI